MLAMERTSSFDWATVDGKRLGEIVRLMVAPLSGSCIWDHRKESRGIKHTVLPS